MFRCFKKFHCEQEKSDELLQWIQRQHHHFILFYLFITKLQCCTPLKSRKTNCLKLKILLPGYFRVWITRNIYTICEFTETKMSSILMLKMPFSGVGQKNKVCLLYYVLVNSKHYVISLSDPWTNLQKLWNKGPLDKFFGLIPGDQPLINSTHFHHFEDLNN